MTLHANSRTIAARRLPWGAEVVEGGVHFRVWAPRRRRVDVVLEPGGGAAAPEHALEREPGGWCSGLVPGIGAGALYRFRLDGGDAFPDPASRFQPRGPHGPSQVVDPGRHRWGDAAWPGPDPDRAVIYELHVGTFTTGGDYLSAARELEGLAELGITVIELMPLAEFPGRFNWGYDGVDLFAPAHVYGLPDGLRAFVDRAHALGLAVILDVVYNHFGPDGNYLTQYSDGWFRAGEATDWGDAIAFDGPDAAAVRSFFTANARHWIAEYHLDGLRLDATHSLHDASQPHIVREVAEAAREAAGARRIYVAAENESQDARHVRPAEAGGYGLDGIWNEDFHHTTFVALTGRREGYFSDYLGTPQELVSAAKHGFLWQGQRYPWQNQRRGTSTRGVPRRRLVHYLENHDQVANTGDGRRTHLRTSPALYRAITSYFLLMPQTPLLLMGQEFGASSPFLYFADHEPALAEKVRAGRREFLAQFPHLALPEAEVPAPEDVRTFERCRLDRTERARNVAMRALHRDLLTMRREDPVFKDPNASVDGAVLGDSAFVLRFASGDEERLLVMNLAADLLLDGPSEPLMAPPAGRRWSLGFCSEHPRYGGPNAAPAEDERGRWRLTAHSAVVMAATPAQRGAP